MSSKTLTADLYFSFRSPYSYLATPRLRALTETYDLDLNVKIVLPLAVREPNFFKNVNPLWPPYLLRDIVRVAEYHGIPISFPVPDPIVQDFTTMKVAEEQPYIHRLSRLGACASERGGGLAFICEVAHLIWSGEVTGWNEGDHLSRAVARAGFDLTVLDDQIEREAERYAAVIERNQADLEAAGHWGVPTLVFEGEPFWGQDRIDLFVWRLRQHGLAEREPKG